MVDTAIIDDVKAITVFGIKDDGITVITQDIVDNRNKGKN